MVFHKQLVGVHLQMRAVPRTAGRVEAHFVSAPRIFRASWRGQH